MKSHNTEIIAITRTGMRPPILTPEGPGACIMLNRTTSSKLKFKLMVSDEGDRSTDYIQPEAFDSIESYQSYLRDGSRSTPLPPSRWGKDRFDHLLKKQSHDTGDSRVS